MLSEESERLIQYTFEFASDGIVIIDVDTECIVNANPSAYMMYSRTHEDFLGKPLSHFIQPDSSHKFIKYIHAVQSQSFSVSQQIHLRQDGSPFYVEMSGSLFNDQGHAYILSIIRDVSDRVHLERTLQKRVESHAREQSTLLEISQTLASALKLQPGLILDQLQVIIEYTHAGLFKLEDATLTSLALRGPQLERAMPFHIQLQSPESILLLFHEQRPTRIADVQSSDPPAQLLRSLLVGEASILLEGVRSWMWVPLVITGRTIGAIGVTHAERNHFTAHDAVLALTVANQAAITMVNAELYDNAQTLATLQERQRLAQNLHDAVNQSLFSAGLIAEVLPRLWEQDPQEGLKSLEDLRRLTRGAQADLRLLLAELRPSTITDADLGDLLRLLGNAMAGRTNLPVAMTIEGEGRLPADVQVAMYRLCQEGLNNIARHAGARRVEISLLYEPGAVEIHIRDDGRGFHPLKAVPGHYGLSMMKERAAAVGAVLSITSKPEHGTEIAIRWEESHDQEAGEP